MAVPAGSIRFNTDSAKMEIYNGDKWWEIDSTSPQEQTGGTRGIFMGGYTSGPATTYNQIDYVNVDSTGNAQDFGDLTQQVTALMGTASSRTRGIRFGGYIAPNNTNVIDYITISSTGDAIDFGDVIDGDRYANAGSDSTRAVQMGEYGGNSHENTIQYVTMATTGDFVDFGDMTQAVRHIDGFGSSIRGVVPGGWKPDPGGNWEGIQYVTIPTLGNSQEFGEISISQSLRGYAASSNSIRGLYGGGALYPSGVQSAIEWVTIATKGNGNTFGDLTYSNRQEGGGCASPVRAIFAGGYSPAATNVINYVSLATQGDAVDFGDLTVARACGGASNAHGGL